MINAKDAKKNADNYLNTEDGQLKAIDNKIHESAALGQYEIELESISDFSKSELEKAGYKISGNKVSW